MDSKLSTEGTQNFVSTSALLVGNHIFQTRILRIGDILKHGEFIGKSAAKLDGWTSWMGPSDHRLFVHHRTQKEVRDRWACSKHLGLTCRVKLFSKSNWNRVSATRSSGTIIISWSMSKHNSEWTCKEHLFLTRTISPNASQKQHSAAAPTPDTGL